MPGSQRPRPARTRLDSAGATHLRDEHSTFSWLLERMIERAGFEIEHAGYGSLSIYADYTCTKR
jgi:hypothetical protein